MLIFRGKGSSLIMERNDSLALRGDLSDTNVNT
jgi:hypothetical protein